MEKFRIKRRRVGTSDVTEVEMEFPTLSDAIGWMEQENENPDREYDIASVALPRCPEE